MVWNNFPEHKIAASTLTHLLGIGGKVMKILRSAALASALALSLSIGAVAAKADMSFEYTEQSDLRIIFVDQDAKKLVVIGPKTNGPQVIDNYTSRTCYRLNDAKAVTQNMIDNLNQFKLEYAEVQEDHSIVYDEPRDINVFYTAAKNDLDRIGTSSIVLTLDPPVYKRGTNEPVKDKRTARFHLYEANDCINLEVGENLSLYDNVIVVRMK
jgi:hypothetical protein